MNMIFLGLHLDLPFCNCPAGSGIFINPTFIDPSLSVGYVHSNGQIMHFSDAHREKPSCTCLVEIALSSFLCDQYWLPISARMKFIVLFITLMLGLLEKLGISFGEFRISLGEFRISLGEFRVSMAEFRVSLGEFRISLPAWSIRRLVR